MEGVTQRVARYVRARDEGEPAAEAVRDIEGLLGDQVLNYARRGTE
ncbi:MULTISPECIES: hypothetical protein [Streptomyces]|nr:MULTISPECIES: hypothetical protein [Streptomyces]RPK91149.1 hypothetical protein EES46_11400 [Streptomyces sp. ADI98-10]